MTRPGRCVDCNSSKLLILRWMPRRLDFVLVASEVYEADIVRLFCSEMRQGSALLHRDPPHNNVHPAGLIIVERFWNQASARAEWSQPRKPSCLQLSHASFSPPSIANEPRDI
jgi:hypothetical protein